MCLLYGSLEALVISAAKLTEHLLLKLFFPTIAAILLKIYCTMFLSAEIHGVFIV